MNSVFPPTCCVRSRLKPPAPAVDARLAAPAIARLYTRIAPVYDLWAALTESRARRRALELAEIQDGQRILEVAVGTGLAFAEIVRRNPGGYNLGIDLSAGMLAKARRRMARQRTGRYALRRGDARQIAADTASFDLVYNSYMFDLIPFAAMDDILREFRRVLKPGGRLVLVNMTRGERCGSGVFGSIYQCSPKTMGGCRGVQMAAPLQRQGFEVQVREYHQQMLFPSEVILALNGGWAKTEIPKEKEMDG